MEHTTPHLFLIHDGARYHTSAAPQAFLAAHRDRSTVEPLPSYSPDDNPIAYLWKKTKKRATHDQYLAQNQHLNHEPQTAWNSLLHNGFVRW
jgi:transposase